MLQQHYGGGGEKIFELETAFFPSKYKTVLPTEDELAEMFSKENKKLMK